MGASSTSSISISLPGVESHDTERRRQIALKALSERLNRSESAGGDDGAAGAKGNWPDLEDDEDNERTALIGSKDDSAPLESVHVAKPIEKKQESREEQPDNDQDSLTKIETTTA